MTLRSRTLSTRACVLPWIFSQRSHLVSLDLGEVNVSQSHNYPAERGVRPNPLESLPPPPV